VGVCALRLRGSRSGGAQKPKVTIRLDGDSIQLHIPKLDVPEGCGGVSAVSVEKGEVLRVTHIASHGGYLLLELEHVSRHRVESIPRASARGNARRGYAWVMIKIPGRNDYGGALDTADRWFKPLDSAE